MRNVVFFESKRELNAQGEWRLVLKCLPNQCKHSHSRACPEMPYNTEWNVQASVADRHMMLGHPQGTVFATVIEGNTFNRANLKTYSRNGAQFYSLTEQGLHLIALTGDWRENNAAVAQAYEGYFAAQQQLQTDDEAEANVELTSQQAQQSGSRRLRPNANWLNGSADEIAAVTRLAPTDALQISRLCDHMALGVAHFQYRKVSDDSVRDAWGTRNTELIRAIAGENNSSDSDHDSLVTGRNFRYFDLARGEWRNFVTSNFIVESYGDFIRTREDALRQYNLLRASA